MGAIGSVAKQESRNIPVNVENSPEIRTERTLYSKSQADEFTKDYTPEQFLGDINNNWTGTLNSLKYAAEDNAPETLNIGGYTFDRLSNPYTTIDKNKDVVVLEYQSTEQVGQEYPVLQVGIRVWRTKGGKVKSEIIRDGYTNKTRFW